MPNSVVDYQISSFISMMNLETNRLEKNLLDKKDLEYIVETRELEYLETIVRKEPPYSIPANAVVVFDIQYMEYSVDVGRKIKVNKTLSVAKGSFDLPKGTIDPSFSDSLYCLLQYKEVREKAIQEAKEYHVMLKLAGEI